MYALIIHAQATLLSYTRMYLDARIRARLFATTQGGVSLARGIFIVYSTESTYARTTTPFSTAFDSDCASRRKMFCPRDEDEMRGEPRQQCC